MQRVYPRAGAVEKLFADAIAAVGRPDIAINTVGKVLKKPFVDITEDEYDTMTAVNSKSAFFFLKEAGRHVNDNGKIVTLVTSLLGAFTPFFYPAEGADAVAYHKSAAALSPFSKTGLTDIEDVVPFIRHLVSDGWWITGQTILINGGYTTK